MFLFTTHYTRRPLWYDELITYYISKAPSLHRLFEMINHVDLNPPLSYLAVRPCLAALGDSVVIVRLTSIVSFFGAAVLLFEYFRRRVGGAFGLLGMGIFFQCGFLYYSVEARPYAMMLLFYTIGVLSWPLATNKQSWSWAHTGIFVSIAGLTLTHCFGPLYGASIGCGELVRSIIARRFDKRVWSAILLPLPLMLTYALMAKPTDLLFPVAFQPNSTTVSALYVKVLFGVAPAAAILGLLTFLPGRRLQSLWSVMPIHEVAMAVCCFLTPLVIILWAMHSHVAFWPRYSIVMIIAVTLLAVSAFASLSGGRTGIALLGSALLLVMFSFQHFPHSTPIAISTDYRNVCPNLPFVAASGLTFVEMDHREPADMVKRLYYLTDREAAVKFAHATIFEGFSTIKQWFPIHANVEPYGRFVQEHPCFMVMSTPDYPEDWLMKKLANDGAQVRYFGAVLTGYKDGMLFEVRMPSERNQPQDTCGVVHHETGSK